MRQVFRWIVMGSMVAMTLTGAGAQDRPGATSAPQGYRVGPGDRLKVNIYNADKLSGDYPVGGDGKIAMPMLGRVAVAGSTLEGVADMISARLREGYMLDPSVTVDIAAYRPVFVLGEVGRPGQYSYAEGMSVLQLIAQAGGFTYRANRGTIKRRGEDDRSNIKEKVEDAAPIQPGDTVIVMQRYF